MNWNALKSGCCPKCGEVLKEKGPLLFCLPECGFKARSEKVLEIINGSKNKHAYNYRDNQAELSNIPNHRH